LTKDHNPVVLYDGAGVGAGAGAGTAATAGS